MGRAQPAHIPRRDVHAIDHCQGVYAAVGSALLDPAGEKMRMPARLARYFGLAVSVPATVRLIRRFDPRG
jgi:hypothetical protein